MEAPIPGFTIPGRMPLWWVVFHQVPDVPEYVVEGREQGYISWFYHNLAHNPAAINQTDRNVYVSHYSAPGGMHAGFEYYRAIPEDAIQNMNYSKTRLTIPVLALTGGFTPAFGGNVTMNSALYGMQQVAENVTGITVPNSGHWIPEEQPKFLIEQLTKFFNS